MNELPLNVRNRLAKKVAKVARLASAREKSESMRASIGSVEMRAAYVIICCAPRLIKPRIEPAPATLALPRSARAAGETSVAGLPNLG